MSLVALLLGLARFLPLETATALIRSLTIGWLLLRPDYRAECCRNYELVSRQRDVFFWIRNAWAVGRNAALMTRLGTRQAEKIIDSAAVHYHNDSAGYLERNLHTAMASFHFGLWEFLPGFFVHRGKRVQLITGKQRDQGLGRLLGRLRRRAGAILAEDLRQVLRSSGSPGITGFMLDNTSRGGATWVECEGFRVRLPVLGFRIAGDGLVTVFSRLERGRLRIDIYPPGDERAAVAALLEQVSARPEQWVWWGKAGAIEPLPVAQARVN